MRIGMVCLLAALWGCGSAAGPEVVVYTSVDEPFARPVLAAFTEKTGIRVRAVFDTEAAKTVGLARRLVTEGRHPRCDVFWNNEILQTVLLKQKGLLEPYRSPEAAILSPGLRDPAGYYACLGGRLRVFLVRKGKLSDVGVPGAVAALTDPRYRAAAAIARPTAGTTLTHAAWLCALYGMERTRALFEGMLRNEVVVVPGNAMAKDLVVEGEAAFCLTDTDDALKGMQEAADLQIVVPDQEKGGPGALLIPGTIALIKGAPHPREARQLIDYLLSREVVERLLGSGAFQVPLRTDVPARDAAFRPEALRAGEVDWERLAVMLPEVQKLVVDIFLR